MGCSERAVRRAAFAAMAGLAAGACGVADRHGDAADAGEPATGWLADCPLAPAPSPAWSWRACPGGNAGCRLLDHDGPLAEPPVAAALPDGDLALAIAVGRADGDAPRWFAAATLGGRGIAAAVQAGGDQARCGYHLEDVRAGELWLGSRTAAGGALIAASTGRDARVLFTDGDGQRSMWDGRLRRTAPRRDLEVYEAGAGPWRAPARVWIGAERGAVGATPPVDLGDRVLLEVSLDGARRIFAWGADGDAAPVASPSPHDAAGNLGSDGEVLVWTEGAGRLDGTVHRDTWIVTAPTGAPERAERIAASGTATVGGAPFRVGCGRAVHRQGSRLHVVDLGRGRIDQPDPPAGFRWGEPVAVTCDELLVVLHGGAGLELARVAWP